ncbi:MAG TPA: modified peptide precursor CbpA [Polyangiales bacterium]
MNELAAPTQHEKPQPQGETARTPVPSIAIRKSCNPDGIGLSHYVLMDKKAAK